MAYRLVSTVIALGLLIAAAPRSAQATKAAALPTEITVIHETGTPNYIVQLEYWQNKHQTTPIPGMKAYSGGSGSQFPASVDLAYHVATIAPMVLGWGKKNHDKIVALKGKPLTAGKYEIAPNHIDFTATATYDAGSATIHLSYHCNPNDNANLKKDFK
jgi:hypothetical protein